MKNEKPNGPDMTGEQKKELQRLRTEEMRLVKEDTKELKRLSQEILKGERALAKLIKQEEAAVKRRLALAQKETEQTLKPLRREWVKRTAGKSGNERLAAVRHRIGILEGRVG